MPYHAVMHPPRPQHRPPAAGGPGAGVVPTTVTTVLAVAVVALVAGAALAGWQPPASKTGPPVPWNGRIPAADPRGFDVLHTAYTLDLESLPPQTFRLTGRADLVLRLLDPPPATLRLDLVDDLSVTALLRDGAAAPFAHAGDSLTVAVPAGAAAGDTVTVGVVYAGTPPRHGPLFAGLLARQQRDGPSVGNVSQPYSTHSWLPSKDHPADKATLELTVTAPDTLTVAATGRLLGTDALDPGRKRWRWASDYPVAPYLIGLLVSDFVSWEEDCGGLPLQYHAFAEHLAEADSAYAATCEMMGLFENLFGPYPFAGEKYAQAEFVWGGAMENQTVSAMGQATLLLPARAARKVVAHELIHHWFGNSLTPGTWRDIWLNEGFARYGEALWIEHSEGRAAYLEDLARLARGDLFQGDGLLGDPDPVLPNLLVYDKGAWVLHMLRRYLGEADFFAGLRAYATDPALVHALTDRDRFAAVMTRVSGRDVAAFLAPWLGTEALPELATRWRPAGGGRTLVEVVQEQAAPFFPLVVPVRVHAGAEAVDRELRMEQLLAGVEVTTATAVDSVVIDPEGWLLWKSAATRPPALLAARPRPNPALQEVRLAYWLAAADQVAAAVYDARGRLVRREDLGAQPATGPREEGGEPRVWIWDGRDGSGRRAAAGVYWLELRTARDRTVRKLTLLR